MRCFPALLLTGSAVRVPYRDLQRDSLRAKHSPTIASERRVGLFAVLCNKLQCDESRMGYGSRGCTAFEN